MDLIEKGRCARQGWGYVWQKSRVIVPYVKTTVPNGRLYINLQYYKLYRQSTHDLKQLNDLPTIQLGGISQLGYGLVYS